MSGKKNLENAVFAGGCFWCMEHPFEILDGVEEVSSGYMGGAEPDPTYEEVSSGQSGHLEVIRIVFDPLKISYEQLLDLFWRQIDPTDDGGSFVDRGEQYRSAIFYYNPSQKKIAEASKLRLEASGRFKKPVVTKIIKGLVFYPAEDYHQDYHRKNPVPYGLYRARSGRDSFIMSAWKDPVGEKEAMEKRKYDKPSREQLKKSLSPISFHVTQEDGTEKAFDNPYWDSKQKGLYVDIVSGEPLFSSLDKFDSGTGWPSFTRPIRENVLEEKKDTVRLFSTVIEVRSKVADSHLGHVFDDGPKPYGLRYCINSAALRFIPADALEAGGYGEFLPLFQGN